MQAKDDGYYAAVARAVLSNADGIINAIDRYIAKADDDLEETLSEEGYANPKETVNAVNSIQEEMADILSAQTAAFAAAVAAAKSDDWKDTKKKVQEMLEEDDTAQQVAEVSLDMMEEEIPALANVYMKETDGELEVSTLRKRTRAWMDSWSEQLGELTNISTHKQITDLIATAIENGDSVDTLARQIMEGGWRSEYYQARRFALTEMLRAHSVAREEAIQQSPSAESKEWVHTGAHKNEPRQNHVAINHQIVPKEQPFVLVGKDGVTYHPMYPKDSILPAGECVNCHCIHRGIANKDILGMSYEDRKKMQEDFVASDDKAWEKELDERNKAKAGIDLYDEKEYGVEYGDGVLTVDRAELRKPSWRNKFSKEISDKKVRRQVVKYSRKAVIDNSGTKYESMYLLDGDTGKLIASIDNENDKIEEGVCYTDDFKEKLKAAQDSKCNIIAIHNHPGGYPPSIDDFRKAFENGYSKGFVIGSNGQVYSYKNASLELSEKDCENIHANIVQMYDSGRDVDNSYKSIYESHGLEYTVD
jgi:hypothetical protein